ncbi:MAG: tetratricopeptide repeat protein [Planctomycetes bacterium]|nr:tetratricopeptide repeat protein [Planctomycetota bacterium]
MKTLLTTLCLSLALMAPAFATDAQAKRLFGEAQKKWDGDPEEVQALLKKAVAAAKSKPLRINLTLILGQFQQGKTGDFDAAIKNYQRVIADTVGEKAKAMRNFKAQALMNLGIVYYTRKHNLDEAVIKLTDSLEMSPTCYTADNLSQLLYRLGRDTKRSELSRKLQLEKSLKIARISLELDRENADRASTPARRAKLRLQLVIVLTALGKTDEAKAEWKATEEKALKNNALYQMAILKALRGGTADEVAVPLKEALKVRPSPVARNQIRWFIRTEPDLAKFVKEASWKALVTDEEEPKKKKRRKAK